ncbi:phage head closure protein [Dongia sp.]|uniref:phage head closure protein n=1 Tax=Dongia sp. TaxID=1977262 RepID=UPI0035B38507
MIKAGELDRRVTLLRPVIGRDGAGGPVTSWQNAGRVWAKVKDISGREYFAAAQVNAEITTTFLIRYRADITPDMRIRYRDRDYDIVAVPEVGNRNEGLQIMAKARADKLTAVVA